MFFSMPFLSSVKLQDLVDEYREFAAELRPEGAGGDEESEGEGLDGEQGEEGGGDGALEPETVQLGKKSGQGDLFYFGSRHPAPHAHHAAAPALQRQSTDCPQASPRRRRRRRLGRTPSPPPSTPRSRAARRRAPAAVPGSLRSRPPPHSPPPSPPDQSVACPPDRRCRS